MRGREAEETCRCESGKSEGVALGASLAELLQSASAGIRRPSAQLLVSPAECRLHLHPPAPIRVSSPVVDYFQLADGRRLSNPLTTDGVGAGVRRAPG